MNILDGVFVFYKLGCFVVTFSIAYVLIDQYFLNDDTSKVLIKRFSEAGRNTFPTITLCLHDGGSNSLYDEKHVLSKTNGDAKNYRDALMGKDVLINTSILQDPNLFLASTIKMESYLLKLLVFDVNSNYIVDWKHYEKSKIDDDNRTEFPLRIYYQCRCFLSAIRIEFRPKFDLQFLSRSFS